MSASLDDPPGELVFVYGGLRKGAVNYPRMRGAIRISTGVVRGRLVKIGWFAALVLDPEAETWVWGDVLRVRDEQLQTFLEYEGLAAEAVEERDCRLADTQALSYVGAGWGWKVRLWEWTGPLDQALPVPSGDWLDVECPQSAPVFTWVAGACTLGMPALVVSSFALRMSVGDLAETLLLLGAALSPFAGWVSLYWASRRRERAALLLLWVALGLGLTSIFALGLLLTVLRHFIR